MENAPLRHLAAPMRLGLAATGGLFAGRLVAEWTRLPGWLVALALGAALVAALWRLPARRIWPLAFLLTYVLAPEPDPRLAVAAALPTTLGLLLAGRPLAWSEAKDGRLPWVDALVLGVAFLALYVLTASPGPAPADSGEFQLVAATLGVAHPPGFPLYTLLAHLAVMLWPGEPAAAVNLFAAVVAAGTVSLTTLAAAELARWRPAGWLAAAALGTATTFWAQAAVANVRGMTALFAAAALLALIHLWRQPARHGAALAFVASLSLGVTHHPSLAFPGIAWAVVAAWRLRQRRISPRAAAGLVLAGALGVLPLVYLPWRAGSGAWGASPALATWSGFWDHVLARGFAGDLFYFVTPGVLLERLTIMGNILWLQFGLGPLAAAVVGWAALARRDRGLALGLGLGIAVVIVITATYRAPQSTEYLMPAYVPLALLIGASPALLARTARATAHRLARPIAAAALALLATTLIMSAWDRAPTRQGTLQAVDTLGYTQTLFDGAPDGALVLANWHWATPLWYRQQVEGVRTDLEIRYVAPEGEAYSQTWEREIATGLSSGRDVIATWVDESGYASLPPAEPLGETLWFRQEPRSELPAGFARVAAERDGVRWLGVDVADAPAAGDRAISVVVAWEEMAESQRPAGLFLHLVGEDGALLAQADVASRAVPGAINLTRFVLVPRLEAPGGQAGLEVGVSGGAQGRFPLRPILLPASQSPRLTSHRVFRTVPSGRPLLRLVGYDWDTTLPGRVRLYLHWQTESGYLTEVRDAAAPIETLEVPGFGPWGRLAPIRLARPEGDHYVPLGAGITWIGGGLTADGGYEAGEGITVAPRFAASRQVMRDKVVSLRLVGYERESEQWAWWDLDDGVPALGALPTLKWERGTIVRDPHLVRVSPDAPDDQRLGALLRLYDAFTAEPVPILDDDLARAAPWIPLGEAAARRALIPSGEAIAQPPESAAEEHGR